MASLYVPQSSLQDIVLVPEAVYSHFRESLNGNELEAPYLRGECAFLNEERIEPKVRLEKPRFTAI